VRQGSRQGETTLDRKQSRLLEAVVERRNMWLALKQVERNKGAAGVDKVTVEQLRA
jgi:hypothetical protein